MHCVHILWLSLPFTGIYFSLNFRGTWKCVWLCDDDNDEETERESKTKRAFRFLINGLAYILLSHRHERSHTDSSRAHEAHTQHTHIYTHIANPRATHEWSMSNDEWTQETAPYMFSFTWWWCALGCGPVCIFHFNKNLIMHSYSWCTKWMSVKSLFPYIETKKKWDWDCAHVVRDRKRSDSISVIFGAFFNRLARSWFARSPTRSHYYYYLTHKSKFRIHDDQISMVSRVFGSLFSFLHQTNKAFSRKKEKWRKEKKWKKCEFQLCTVWRRKCFIEKCLMKWRPIIRIE